MDRVLYAFEHQLYDWIRTAQAYLPVKTTPHTDPLSNKEVAEAAGADPEAIDRIRTERSAPDSLEERPDTDD